MECACKSENPYICFGLRYDIKMSWKLEKEVEEQGGPCKCTCHANFGKEWRKYNEE